MAHGDAWGGKWRGNWRMEWVASTLNTTSEHGVSSINTADARTSAASSRLNWHPRWFKWTCPFRRKTKSGFCACAITFQTQSTCDRTTSLPPSYITDTLSSTASSLQHPPGPTHIILKNEAVSFPKSWNRQSYVLSPCAHDARNMQGVSETGMDEARCVSHPCCWNGTELQHLATFLLWKTSEKSHHKFIGYQLPVSFICISITMLHCPFSDKMRYSFRLWVFNSRNACYHSGPKFFSSILLF